MSIIETHGLMSASSPTAGLLAVPSQNLYVTFLSQPKGELTITKEGWPVKKVSLSQIAYGAKVWDGGVDGDFSINPYITIEFSGKCEGLQVGLPQSATNANVQFNGAGYAKISNQQASTD